MTLNTERLVLTTVTPNDLENIHNLHSLPEVDEFNTLGIPSSISETEQILKNWIKLCNENENFIFSVTNVFTNQFIACLE